MNPLRFPKLSDIPNFHHAISTRDGGFSTGDYASLNLAFHVGDDAEIVRRNRRAWARELGFNIEKLVAAQQVHGDGVTVIGAADAGRGALDGESALPATDALVTAQIGVPLLILVADCAPILLVEPEARVLAVVHAGWRGALAGVASNAVAAMTEIGADATRIRAGIGPCLCPQNLEVGPEVAAMVADKSALEARGEKFALDLRALIRRDLRGAGVVEKHIGARPECPRAENATFFSHRGQKGCAGRFGLVAWWS